MLEEFRAVRLTTLLERHRRDVVITDVGTDGIELAQTCNIGNRLDIEYQNGRHCLLVHTPALFW